MTKPKRPRAGYTRKDGVYIPPDSVPEARPRAR